MDKWSVVKWIWLHLREDLLFMFAVSFKHQRCSWVDYLVSILSVILSEIHSVHYAILSNTTIIHFIDVYAICFNIYSIFIETHFLMNYLFIYNFVVQLCFTNFYLSLKSNINDNFTTPLSRNSSFSCFLINNWKFKMLWGTVKHYNLYNEPVG